MASSEWFFGGRCFRTAEKFRRIRRCALQSKSISPVANRQSLPFTLYDTNLFGAYAPPTNYSLIAIRCRSVGAPSGAKFFGAYAPPTDQSPITIRRRYGRSPVRGEFIRG